MKSRAIILGAVIDNVGTLVGGWMLMSAAAFYYSQVAPGEVEDMMRGSSSLYALMFTLGTLYTVVGGFICARYSRGSIYRNAAVMGLISTAVGVQAALPTISLSDVAALSTTLPAALAGAWLSVTLQHRARV